MDREADGPPPAPGGDATAGSGTGDPGPDGAGRQTVTVLDPGTGEAVDRLRVPRGANLRRVIREAGHSPYTRVTRRANCGGRGICATCGVRIADGDAPAPTHWHDRLADRFGYPRLSCQVTVESDLTVWIPEKLVWGGRESGDGGAVGDSGTAGDDRGE